MGRWVVFSEVVCFVEATGCPVEVKLFLGNAVFEPMIPHVEGFGTFHADLGFENVMCGGVVGLERRAGGGLVGLQEDAAPDFCSAQIEAQIVQQVAPGLRSGQ